MSQTVVDPKGRVYRLTREIASGGEGAVYDVDGAPGIVAKLYRKPPTSQTVAKLTRMVGVSSEALRKVAAWPSALLASHHGGAVIGFTMPRFSGHQPVHHLHNPAQRVKYFPKASWAFLVHAARNCAAAFEEVHRAGCLVGDVNQSNVLVAENATVGLIDCDSFQVRSNGDVYLCEVGVPLYTPPELQGRSYRGLVRSENHDRFGLAVLVFQALFMGRHPYVGRYLGADEMSPERAVAEYRFAYAADAPSTVRMERPPHTLALTDVSPELTTLFRRAFTHGSEAANARPTAAEWRGVLDGFRRQLRQCPAEKGHLYYAAGPECPWCRIAAANGPNHFRGLGQVATTFVPDNRRLAALLQKIEAIRTLSFKLQPEMYALATAPAPVPVPEDTSFHALYARILASNVVLGLAMILGSVLAKPLGGIGVALVLVFLPWWLVHRTNSPHERERRARQRALERADFNLDAIEGNWNSITRQYEARVRETRTQMASAKAACEQLAARFAAARADLDRDKEKLARAEFLRTQFLIDFEIPKIGSGRKQVLASYGIETAFDLEPDRIMAVKGFGETLSKQLMGWKRERAAAFTFDPKRGVPEAEVRALVGQFQREQAELFARLETGAARLETLVAETRQRLDSLEPDLRQWFAKRAQARANLDAVVVGTK